jgi:ammonia channel protein AmtB
MGFAKIIGDLFGGYVVHIAGGIAAIVVASEAVKPLAEAASRISGALG